MGNELRAGVSIPLSLHLFPLNKHKILGQHSSAKRTTQDTLVTRLPINIIN